MSEDPKQEYFSDGITEDLTSSLSRIPGLFVIARHSAFTYKGKAVKVQEVSREMGVRYVLTGSVRHAGDQVRVTAQLIDAITGGHLWSERYDRPLQDIFAVQDDIVQKIVTNLRVEVVEAEFARVRRIPTDNLTAYDSLLRGSEAFRRFTKEANIQARQMFERATKLDPHYAQAYVGMSATYYVESTWGWSQDPQTLEHALAMGQQAVVLNDSLPSAHGLLGMIYAVKRQYEQAIAESEWAIALDPNSVDSYVQRAEALNTVGRPEEALSAVQQAIRLNPRGTAPQFVNLGMAYYSLGQYTDAISTFKRLITQNPNFLTAYSMLSLSYVEQWRSQQSQDPQTLTRTIEAAQHALALNGSYWLAHVGLGLGYLFDRQYEQAIAAMEQSITLNSDAVGGYALLAMSLSYAGKSAEALSMIEEALHHKPQTPNLYLRGIGSAYYLAGKHAEAIASLQQYLRHYPNILEAHLTLTAAYSELGRIAEAQAAAAEVWRLNPQFSLAVHKQRMPIKDPAVLERHIAALRKAGLK
jgi:TolB-like protein/Tfp pilus assembly protein PilF